MKNPIIYLFLVLSIWRSTAQSGFCMNPGIEPIFPGLGSPAFAKGDFNNDGMEDVCLQTVDGTPRKSVSVLLSDGVNSYTPTVACAISYTGEVTLITPGDFDKDGNLDVLAACDSGGVFYFLKGNGTGGFSSKTAFATSNVVNSLIAFDFNKDGNLDIAYSCINSNSVSVVYASGTGFSNPVNYSILANPSFLLPGNFNNDSYPDLFVVVSNYSYFLKGGAGGTFTVTNGFALNAADVIAEDIDSDSRTDLIYTDITTSKIHILKRNGDFTFNPAPSYVIPGLAGGLLLGKIRSGDFNKDDKLDLATISNSNYLTILPGTGNGLFSGVVSYSVYPFGSGIFQFLNLLATDLNHDSKLDLVAQSWNTLDPLSRLSVFVNCNTVELNEIENESLAVKIFPNPANNLVELSVSDLDLAKKFKILYIYNNLGQLIRKEETEFKDGGLNLKTSDLAGGVYSLQIQSVTNETVSKRFVISR